MGISTEKKHHTALRIAVVCSVFFLICAVYAVRMVMIFLRSDAIGQGNTYAGDTVKRTETVTALRGEIYDVNGKKLVANRTTSDLTVDANTLPSESFEKNLAILKLLYAIEACGESDKIGDMYFPLEGQYPTLTWKTSFDSAKFQKFCRLNELDQESVGVDELVTFLIKEYRLTGKNAEGNHLSDGDITKLLAFWYAAEVADFGPYSPYTLARNISDDLLQYLKERGYAGAAFATVSTREYLYPGYASHILGRTGKIQAENWEYYRDLGYSMNATVGIDGCEKVFETYLRGKDGPRVITENRDGEIIDEYWSVEPVAGNDVYLTIDIDMQIAAEDALAYSVAWVQNRSLGEGSLTGEDCSAGAVVALDPKDNAVLACASYPTFDLSTFSADYAALSSDAGKPLYNRALNGLYAPGSTFKIATSVAALEEGIITASTTVNCTGQYTYYDDYQPKCQGIHGYINVAEAIRVSCNSFFYEVGRRMGIDTLNRYCSYFGLGQKTGVELSEATGILAGRTYREENNTGVWSGGDTLQASIGQSDNLFSPIQLAAYISTVTNGGKRYETHLLSRVVSYADKTELIRYAAIDRNGENRDVTISASSLATVGEGMRQMVATGSTVQSFLKDCSIPVSVGGKSGTAQVSKTKSDNALFVATAPYVDPDIVVAVVLEQGAVGSYASYPALKVIEAYYND